MERKDILKRWRDKKRKEAEKLLGNKCYFCNRNKNLVYHEKKGRKHSHDQTAVLVVKNPQSFVRLCHPCHRAVHWLMEKFEWQWEKITENLK
ncbi:MAG: hypothetical protein Q8R18_01760 [bacterium]|nr:hypothetical protein [bacterium]